MKLFGVFYDYNPKHLIYLGYIWVYSGIIAGLWDYKRVYISVNH